jgi:ABC-type glutathione transport system ATPase component
MIKKPSILILDEATSALDVESEALVNEALVKAMQPKVTTISIAHRLSTISRSDEVIVIADGKVQEQGNFFDLYRDPESALSQLLKQRENVLDSASNKNDEVGGVPRETIEDLEEELYEATEELKNETEDTGKDQPRLL